MSGSHDTGGVTAPASGSPSSARIFGTFGLYRYALAALVMVSHLLSQRWQVIGQYAVFGFFILSGYVVSYICAYTYLPLEDGYKKYAVNRALRIYPPFWAASLLTLAVLMVFYAAPSAETHSVLGYPRQLHGPLLLGWVLLNLSALSSLLMMGYMLKPTLMPAAWSLGTEIFFWALMPLFLLYRRARICLVVFAVCYTGLGMALWLHPPRDILIFNYFAPMAGALPYCIGLFCFLRKQKARPFVPHWAGIGAMLMLLALVFFCRALPNPYGLGLYLAILFHTLIIAYLSRFDQRIIRPLLRKLDTGFGDLAYPIFLMHVPVVLVIDALVPSLRTEHFAAWLVLAVTLTNGAALLLHRSVELPVERLRQRFRRPEAVRL